MVDKNVRDYERLIATATSALRARAEFDGEHLGISARQLPQSLRLGHLRGNPRRVLRCLERPDGHT
jgi:hypothetical protein